MLFVVWNIGQETKIVYKWNKKLNYSKPKRNWSVHGILHLFSCSHFLSLPLCPSLPFVFHLGILCLSMPLLGTFNLFRTFFFCFHYHRIDQHSACLNLFTIVVGPNAKSLIGAINVCLFIAHLPCDWHEIQTIICKHIAAQWQRLWQ